jgi:hypothetical protein
MRFRDQASRRAGSSRRPDNSVCFADPMQLVLRTDSTAGAVLGVAAVAVVASYVHAYDLVRMPGQSGGTARMVLPR